MKITRRTLLLTPFVPSRLAPQSAREAEDRAVAGILAKRRRGEPVTAEEQALPPRDSTGLVPLTDLGTGTYKGEPGGLYPGGRNVPPPGRRKAGLQWASQIAPLDAEGRKSADGKMVLLSIGMSNTTQEFQAFQKLAAAEGEINPRLVIVDGAQGGQTAAVTADPQANFWKVAGQRLSAAGVTARQAPSTP